MRPYFLLHHYNPTADEKQPKFISAAAALPQTTQCRAEVLYTLRAHRRKQVDAPQRSRARQAAPARRKTALYFKICKSESTPVTAQARRQKDHPDTLTDDKNAPATPQANLYRQSREPMQTEYPHRINARRSEKIAYRSTVKIVSQKA